MKRAHRVEMVGTTALGHLEAQALAFATDHALCSYEIGNNLAGLTARQADALRRASRKLDTSLAMATFYPEV